MSNKLPCEPINSKLVEKLVVRQLGVRPYLSVWDEMQAFTNQRSDECPDEIWVVEHEPVFTQGQAGKPEHVIAPGDIPIVKTDRGGQVTYHGPGQLVVYPLLKLKRLNLGVRDLVSCIERSVIESLAHYGIDAKAKLDAPGVYVDGKKIASLGLRVRRGCSFHGVSINVDMNLEPFARINPCGYKGMKMTQLSHLLGSKSPNVDRYAQQYLPILQKHLGLKI